VAYAFLKGFALAGLAGAAAFGWSYNARNVAVRDAGQIRQANATCETRFGDCAKARDAERQAREATEKAANEAATSLNASRAEIEELRADAEKRVSAFKSLTEKFRKMIDSGKLQVVLRHGRMVVKLPAGVLFASGSAELSSEGKDECAEVARILRQVQDRRFMVAGHTDNVPIAPPSPFKNNLELSTARALTVAEHLIGAGMNSGRLVAAGYAEHEPVRENTTEPGRRENRRIEIVLLPDVTELPTVAPEIRESDAGAPPDAEAKR
jgi:chemotaxis protein MotB